MTGTTKREPITTYVLLEVQHRFPLPGGVGEECARRLWCKDEVLRVHAIVDAPALADVVAAIEALP